MLIGLADIATTARLPALGAGALRRAQGLESSGMPQWLDSSRFS